MFNIRSIIRNNNATFYNYRTGIRFSIWPRVILFSVISLSAALLKFFDSAEFLGAVLAVESILVGFSFSVLFFLLGNIRGEVRNHESIEDEVTEKKLRILSKEIFFNVSYFNLVTVMVVLLCLILLIPDEKFRSLDFPYDIHPSIRSALNSIWDIFKFFGLAIWSLFSFLLLESMYTFVRTVGRVTFYFDRTLELYDTPQD